MTTDTSALASDVTATFAATSAITVAVVGLIGVVAGATITVLGNFMIHYFNDRPRKQLDEKRKELLREMLSDTRFQWRKSATLSRVIGADEETTKRLLIEIGARGSEREDGMWGLIDKHPFNKMSQ